MQVIVEPELAVSCAKLAISKAIERRKKLIEECILGVVESLLAMNESRFEEQMSSTWWSRRFKKPSPCYDFGEMDERSIAKLLLIPVEQEYSHQFNNGQPLGIFNSDFPNTNPFWKNCNLDMYAFKLVEEVAMMNPPTHEEIRVRRLAGNWKWLPKEVVMEASDWDWINFQNREEH